MNNEHIKTHTCTVCSYLLYFNYEVFTSAHEKWFGHHISSTSRIPLISIPSNKLHGFPLESNTLFHPSRPCFYALLDENKSWLLHPDNAPAYNALSIRRFLVKKNIRRTGTIFLTTWSCHVTSFFSPSSRRHQEDLFWRCGGHKKFGKGDEGHPRRILPVVHRITTEKDGKVHQTRWGITLKRNRVVCLELK